MAAPTYGLGAFLIRVITHFVVVQVVHEDNMAPHLSNEVWAHVLSYLPGKSDLKIVRLVSSRFRDLAAVPLFHTIVTGLHPKYLERLNDLASCPHLRPHIREIQFEGDLLEGAFLDYDTWYDWNDYQSVALEMEAAMWEHAYKHKEKRLLELDPLDQHEYLRGDQSFRKKITKYHGSFIRLYEGQRQLVESPLRTATLLEVVKRLTSLNSVIFNAQAEEINPWRSHRRGEYGLPPALKAQLHLHDEALRHGFRPDDPELVEPLLFFFRSIAKNISLQELSCHTIPWNFWHRHLGSYKWSEIDIGIANVLRNIRRLSLTPSFGHLGDFHEGSALWRLWRFVQTPGQLEALYLDFAEYCGDHHEAEARVSSARYTDISAILERLRLPFLRRLHLFNCEFSQAAFVGCMVSHASSLKGLYVGDVHLTQAGKKSGSWEAVIRAIAPKLALERVELKSLHDENMCALGWQGCDSACAALTSKAQFINGMASYVLHQGQADWPARPAEYGGCCRCNI